MFDFAGSEVALVAVVALILIGPKDLPVAVKAVTGVIKKARRMAAEFQVHVDDMMKDADLGELRSGLNEIRRMDIKGKILNAIDDDGALRKTVSDARTDVEAAGTPTGWTPPPPPVPAADLVQVPELPRHSILAPATPVHEAAPAFIPPGATRVAPAFIPPGAAASGRTPLRA